MSDDYQVIAYTDGGCRGNPGPGGWGFMIYNPKNGQALERCGGEAETTNNRMEILAAIMALRSLKKDNMTMLLYSDSQYVIKAVSEWMPGWKARGWKRKDGPLKNVDLLQELDQLNAKHLITWRWVKGHDGNPGNEHVDALTNRAMDAIQNGQSADYENRFVWA